MAEARAKRGDASEKPPAPKRKPPKRKRVEAAARRYFAAMEARDPQGMASCWSQDGVQDLVPLRVMRGPHEIAGFFAAVFSALPDAQTTVRTVVADDRRAAVEWRLIGTFSGTPFEGVEATGGRLELRGLDLLEVEEEERITRSTAYYDGAAFMRQLGMMPAQDSGAERAMKSAFNAATKVRRALAERRGPR